MVNPVNGNGSKTMQARGRLAAYKQDLLAHRDGTGFRQDATTVDMNPQLVHFPAATVQATLEAIETFLLNDETFVSVGNGTTSFGTFNIGDPGYPTVESCIIGAQSVLRLSSRGGVILIKAGVYNFTSTVILNAGVSVIGEVGGTILNAQSANPIFRVRYGATETIRIAPAVLADTSKISRFYNLTFMDAFGDVNPYLSLSSLIIANRGTNISVENCSVFGKIGAAGSPPSVTRLFIAYDSGSTSSYNSILNIENCYIAGIQQVVDFDNETARNNKLTVKNNRIWVSGRLGLGIAARYTSAIAFRACDANLSHNQIKFGLNLASLQTITTAFSCYDPGTNIKNLIIMGNQGSYYDETVADDDNRLIGEDSSGLENFRSCISGNMMGASSDSGSWYITVGDGSNSIGDINGEFAIQNIVAYFINMPVADINHGSVVIYVRQGDYTITDKTVFETPASATATGLPLSLIGVTENGNLPTITFNVTAPTVGGQPMMFGHRIENINFDGASNYYKIMLRNDFSNPDGRTVFFRDVHVKNCSFYNCSIGMINSTASTAIDYMKNNTFIEDCQFANGAIIGNLASPETMVAIKPGFKNGKIYIKRCATTTNSYRGLFLYLDSTNVDTKKITEIYVEDCVFSTLNTVGAGGYLIYVIDIKKFVMKGCRFDTSSATTQPSEMFVIKCNNSTSFVSLIAFSF